MDLAESLVKASKSVLFNNAWKNSIKSGQFFCAVDYLDVRISSLIPPHLPVPELTREFVLNFLLDNGYGSQLRNNRIQIFLPRGILFFFTTLRARPWLESPHCKPNQNCRENRIENGPDCHLRINPFQRPSDSGGVFPKVIRISGAPARSRTNGRADRSREPSEIDSTE